MRLCVTGGAGFIGSYIANELAKKQDVFVIDNLITGNKENVDREIKLVAADIISEKSFEAIKKERPEVLFHFAYQSGVRQSIKNCITDVQKNLLDSVKFIDYCLRNRVKKIIFASSGGTVYGDAKIIPTPEDYPLKPISPYGASKVALEFYIEILCKKYDADFLILRYSNVYGPRQRPDTDAGVISIFTDLMKRNEDVYIYGSGKQTRDYIHISDALNFTVKLFEENLSGVYNVGTGIETSVNEIFNLLKEILNYKKPPIYKRIITGEILRCALDISKITKTLNIFPAVNVKDGVRSFVKTINEVPLLIRSQTSENFKLYDNSPNPTTYH